MSGTSGGFRLFDDQALEAIDPRSFRRRRPYPWWAGPVLRPEAWQALHARLPELEQLEALFGKKRRFGQQSHDRYALDYRLDLPVHPIWHQLVEELESPAYHRFLARRLGRHSFVLRFHWHYTPRGGSVSPHCDARRKLGSQIFYFNDPQAWDPSWGGQTCILDDGGRFRRSSHPSFSDLEVVDTPPVTGNQSLLFARRRHSWHGVRALRCPEGELRRVFIVVALSVRPWSRRRSS